jgi:fluoroquinolone transport system permease protein
MMNRFLPTIKLDIALQAKYGFYYAAAFSAIVFIVLMSQVQHIGPQMFIPVLVLFNLMIGTFYFIAGVVLFEKGEGVLQALIVSPLRVSEYLGSKVLTLTLLAIIENLTMVTIVFGTSYDVLLLAIGTVIASMIYILFGFVLVSRYSSISDYLLPSIGIVFVILAPLLDYFGIIKSAIFYLHPMQAPLILMKAAFIQVEIWELAYGVLYSILWIAIGFALSKIAFNRYIVNKEGCR